MSTHYWKYSKLQIFSQFIGPMEWLTHELVTSGLMPHNKTLEMLILSNTGETPMPLGMETLNAIIDTCPEICCVGNLRSWTGIDYYDPHSANYYKYTESDLGKLKQKALKSNWNLDLESENLDYLYENIM